MQMLLYLSFHSFIFLQEIPGKKILILTRVCHSGISIVQSIVVRLLKRNKNVNLNEPIPLWDVFCTNNRLQLSCQILTVCLHGAYLVLEFKVVML